MCTYLDPKLQHEDVIFVVIEVLQCEKPFRHMSVSSKWKMTGKRLSVKVQDAINVSWPPLVVSTKFCTFSFFKKNSKTQEKMPDMKLTKLVSSLT